MQLVCNNAIYINRVNLIQNSYAISINLDSKKLHKVEFLLSLSKLYNYNFCGFLNGINLSKSPFKLK